MSQSKQSLVSAQDVCYQAGGRAILENVSMSVKAGETVTLIGPNGAGKTSLIRLLMGICQPTQGQVHQAPELVIGYMPQKLHLPKTIPLSVNRFLQLAGAGRGEIADALARTGVDAIGTSPIQAISGGELQRVLLARAILKSPHLLVLDEPVQGVDVSGRLELYHLIRELAETNHCAVLMVSHDLHLVMANTDKVICLNHHICCHGHPESVSQHPEYIALFGESGVKELAFYTHHHDHHHDASGHVISKESEN